jgi:hypothetical protein
MACYVSTFDGCDADFTLTGFSAGGVPTNGPDTLLIENIVGTYDLNIPSAGGLYSVTVEGCFGIDYDSDGTYDFTQTIDPTYVGDYVSPGPSTAWSGDITLPDFSYDLGFGTRTMHDIILAFDVDVDGPYGSGPFGPNAYALLTLSNGPEGNLIDLNTDLTILDGMVGGGDGIVEGLICGELTFTLEPVPAPATAMLLGLGGLVATRRRRS